MKNGFHKLNRIVIIMFFCLVAITLARPTLANGEYTVRVVQVQDDAYPEITLYVEVTGASGQRVVDLQRADFIVTEDGQPVDIVDFAGVGEERPVDIVFVFDTTGSMGEEVDGVKETSIRFAQGLEEKGRDYRLGLVTFWDEVLGVYGTGGQLTGDAREFKGWIEDIWVLPLAGGDEPENSFGALKEASRMSFRAEAQRVFILITDAPAHYYGDIGTFGGTYDDPDLNPDRILSILAEQTITVYSVAYDHPDFRRLAGETGGKFYDINREPDFTGIIEEIGGAIATQYRLTYRSPRPTYDGTRRDIQVEVSGGAVGGGGSASSVYLEKHLLNVQSDPLVGVFLMLPLLVLLMAPTGLRLATRVKSSVSSQPDISPPPPTPTQSPQGQLPLPISPQPPPVSFEQPTMTPSISPSAPYPALPQSRICPHCGHSLRFGAKFCGNCGQSTTPPLSPQPLVSACPSCGQTLRPAAKFCGYCGYKIGSG